MLIDKVEIIDYGHLTEPGDDPLLVAAHSRGVTGYYGPVGQVAAEVIMTRLAEMTVGTPVHDHTELQRRVRKHLAGHRPAVSWALGALDCAVWDLHGRLEGTSVTRILGGPTAAPFVPAYASWLKLDVADPRSEESILRVSSEDWQFTKWGLRWDGPSDALDAYRLADMAHHVSSLVGRPAAFDALCTWSPTLTRRFAAHLDRERLVWLEDPLPPGVPDLCAELASSLPLAIGEHLCVDDDPATVIEHTGPAAFTLDVVGCGGLTRALELTAMASAAQLPVYPHGRSLLPAIHLASAFTAVKAVEYQLQWQPRRQRLFLDPLTVKDGTVLLPEGSGLGLTPRTP